VVEAGSPAPNEPGINIPGRKGSTLGSRYDWNFTTTPQAGLNGRRISANRGRVLGGTSALNLMTWDRGSVPDYDAWEALGNPGWNWENFISAMLKVETFDRTNNQYGDEGVGTSGPIQTLINRFVPPQQDGFIPALESLGVPNNLNSLGGDPLGVMLQPSNIRESNYTRSYAVDYLSLAGPNLVIWNDTTVSNIVLSKSNGSESLVATGINIGGNTVAAVKEVILSTGAFQTPTLLELSGIGDSSVLAAAGIDTLLELPGVGSNLQDHIRIQNSYRLKPNYTISFDELRTNATYAAQQLALWQDNQYSAYDYTGSGYAYLTWAQALGNASSELVDLARQVADPNSKIDQHKLAYLTTDLSTKVPEVEFIFSDGYTGVKGAPPVGSANYDSHFFTLIGVIQHPFSKGSVHINASDPTGKPIINPNYVSNPYDLRAIVEATKLSRRIAQSAGLGGAWSDEYEPGFDVVTAGGGGEAAWEEFARNTTLSIYHPLGTCAMLPRADGGVVSPDLVVYGTSNLRVVDASVIPIQPSGHIQTMVYGVAELAAARIVDQYSGA
jgi:choline dehydrogenase-like flavoprotein